MILGLSTDNGILALLITTTVTAIGGFFKLILELKKIREVPANVVMNGYSELYQELRTQISELKESSREDRIKCDQRIAAIEKRHDAEIKDVKTFHANELHALRQKHDAEVRELRLRISHLEQRETNENL